MFSYWHLVTVPAVLSAQLLAYMILFLSGRHIVSAATALKTPRCAFRVLFQLAHCWMASSLLSKRAPILDVSHDGSSIFAPLILYPHNRIKNNVLWTAFSKCIQPRESQ
jgi:hypothetical protein